MNKKFSSTAALILTSSLSASAYASLANNAILDFTSGNCGDVACLYYDSSYALVSHPVTGGSYFGIDTNGNNVLDINERTAMTNLNGVYINTAQPAYGNSNSEILAAASIDEPFYFYGAYGLHHTTSPISVISDDGTGHVVLDFSGWQWFWNGAFVNDNNPNANLVCESDCSLGDTFSLDYMMYFTSGAVYGFQYQLHLEGTIGSAVPLPAAFWLFGSGFIGLLGFAHTRKTNL